MNKYFLSILYSVSLLPFSSLLPHKVKPSSETSSPKTTNTETTETVKTNDLQKKTKTSSSESDNEKEFIKAAKNGDTEKFEELINNHGIPINCHDSSNRTALHWAAYNGHDEILKLLFKNNDANPLMKAWYWLVGSLLAPDSKNKDGYTPLHIAALFGHNSVITIFIENGTNVSIKNNQNGFTPLLCASYKGHISTVLNLLDNGAVLDETNHNGENALHIATKEGHETTVDILAQHEELINTQNKNGYTPLVIAVRNNKYNIAKILLKHGADATIKSKFPKALPDTNDNTTAHTRTLIDICIQKRNPEMLKLMIENGAPINELDRDGNSPLANTIKNDNTILSKILIDNGAALVTKENSYNKLFYAISTRSYHSIEQILQQQGIVNIPDTHGITPPTPCSNQRRP